MALILNPTYSTSNSFATPESLIVEDSTGAYNVTTNPGGYGTPNEDRVDLGLVITVEKKGYGSTADVEITYDNSVNTLTTVASWTIAVAIDGWFKITCMGIPVWDVSITYAANQAVAYNNVIYTSVAGGNLGNAPGGAEWDTSITLITIRDNISTYSPTTTIHVGVLDKIVTSLGDIGYGDAVSADTAKDCAPDCYDDINETNKIWAYLEGSKISGARSKFMEGERKVLIYTDLIAGKDCKIC